MRAIVQNQYGPAQKVLQLKEIPSPEPTASEVLIRIKATAINDYDWSLTTGRPLAYRLMFGLMKPKNPIPGMEIAGVIERIGSDVDDFKVGDEVYGDISDHGFGGFAELVAIHEKAIRLKPKHLSFVEAAAIPHAGLLAWQGLIKMGGLSSNQKVLINGAGGGVGAIAIQLAKTYSCEVTAVDAEEKAERMKALGADHTLDYRKQDFTKLKIRYDLILDCKTSASPRSYLKVLEKHGRYISIGGNATLLIRMVLYRLVRSKSIKNKLQILALKVNHDLKEVVEYFEEHQIRVAIDGPYSLAEIPRLVQYFGEGKHHGKVVVIP
ncbi:MAG: NAD(P)-dependent alcohol dehydrogenase [Cyclobacteriaceae bacterium]